MKNLLSSKQDSHVLDPDLAKSYRKLERLSGIVDILQKHCANFMKLGVQLTEAGLTLANDVSEFYSSNSLDSRQKSVRGFVECQAVNHNKSNEELRANLSGHGALAEFSTWREELAIAKSKVDECQRVVDEETSAVRRLVSLREQLRKKRDKTGVLFAFGVTGNELHEIEQKIPQLEAQHRQLAQKASSLKIEVDQLTQRLVANRFNTFDAIFASFMETQMDFYARCNGEARKLEQYINNYSKQYSRRRLSNANAYEEIPSKNWQKPATSQVEKGATTPEPEIVAGLSGEESGEVDTVINIDVEEDTRDHLASDIGSDLSRTIPFMQPSDQPEIILPNSRKSRYSADSFPCSLNDISPTKDLLGLAHAQDSKGPDGSPSKPLRLCLGLWWIDLSEDTAASERGMSLSMHEERVGFSQGTTGEVVQAEANIKQKQGDECGKNLPAKTELSTMDFLFLNPETEGAPSDDNKKQSGSFDFLKSLVSRKYQKQPSTQGAMNEQEIQPSLLDDVTENDLGMFLDDPVPRSPGVKVERQDSHGDEIMRGFGKKVAPKRLQFSEREQQEIAMKMEQSKREYEKRIQAERDMQTAFEGELSKAEAKLNKWEYTGNEGKQRRNIRNLLSTLHTVLWPDNSWKPVAISALISKRKIKDAYRAAILEVHPDKHTKDSLKVQAVSSRTFEALNEAFHEFRQQNR